MFFPLFRLKKQAKLKAVVFRTESYDKKNIDEIQLKGNLQQDIFNGQAVFSKITFSSTSFQNHVWIFFVLINLEI